MLLHHKPEVVSELIKVPDANGHGHDTIDA